MLDVLEIRACRRGDEDALGRIIDKYAAYVCAVIRRVLGNRMAHEDVEELASDVFYAFWQNADKADGQKLRAYLGSIARNKAINRLRQYHEDLHFEDDWISLPAPSLEGEQAEREQRALVRKAVLGMEETDRRIFLLHYYDCRSVTDIAAELDMSGEAVKKRLSRGRVKLQNQLNRGGDGNGEADIRAAGQCADS
ncbi:MAG: sigma-70 family RNA polymerase sigma factor [Coriobacteriia bacterium]|nr:sigma-70 family RNA polymerase sigma factor [Coriobacteriia bacterium]